MLGVLIPSLATTSPLPAISDKTSTSGFLVALNELLGGDSNERIQSKRNNERKIASPMTRGFLTCDSVQYIQRHGFCFGNKSMIMLKLCLQILRYNLQLQILHFKYCVDCRFCALTFCHSCFVVI